MGKNWLVVGLGNPRAAYEHTRHNVGVRVVEALRERLEQAPFRRSNAVHARISRGTALLAIPETFMNNSGEAVQALVRHFRIPLDRLLIVHDDKDLAFGKLKLQRGRSAAGHRGVDSIIGALNSKAFWRLRIGIGSPPPGMETDTFVLEPFSKEEERKLTVTVIPKAAQTILDAMN